MQARALASAKKKKKKKSYAERGKAAQASFLVSAVKMRSGLVEAICRGTRTSANMIGSKFVIALDSKSCGVRIELRLVNRD